MILGNFDFMEKIDKRLRLGVVGYCSPTKFDETKALSYIKEAFDEVGYSFKDYQITIVSGLTNDGILRLAYEEARGRGWKTAGVACEKAYEFRDNWFPVDEDPVIIGKNWGDESEVFLNSIDALVRIGGGIQSLDEATRMKNRNKPVYEFELEKL